MTIYFLIIVLGLVMLYASGRRKNYQDISVEDLNSKKFEQATLIDVRSESETSQGSIANSLKFDLHKSFKTKVKHLDKSKIYVLFCRSGRRSATAANIMSEIGFRSVYNLLGGYNAWVKA